MRMAKARNSDNTNVGKDEEKMDHSHIANGNVK